VASSRAGEAGSPGQGTGEAVFHRYVALGDSTTEGLDDPAPDGGYRGWADRLAERLATANPELQYANLAIRGRKLGQIRAEQLEPALALEPDLASVLGGVNDVLRRHVDLAAIAADLDDMVSALRARGATVLMVSYPDLTQTISLAAGRVRTRVGELNGRIRSIAARRGAVLVDLERDDIRHPHMWSTDRLHASPLGHERIAAVAAAALGLEPGDPSWAGELPEVRPRPLPLRVAGDAAWAGRHLAPWVMRRLRGVSSGDGREAKRPSLAPLERPDAG
jgi:lysophospholipase L1-like esterase